MAKFSATAIAAVLFLCGIFVSGQSAPEKGTADQPSRYTWYEIAKVNAGKYPAVREDRFAVSRSREHYYTGRVLDRWNADYRRVGSHRVCSLPCQHGLVEKMITAFEKADKALNLKNANLPAQVAEAAGGSRWELAEYDKEISYRPGMVPIANTTWW